MKRAACFIVFVCLAALPAAAGAAKAEAKAAVKLEALKPFADLPQAVDIALKAGASEEEMGKTLRKLKEDKVDGEAAVEVAKHFKKQADDGNSDKGLSDVVHACLAQGKKGTELVACVQADWDKVKKDDKGKPGVSGKPDEAGKPDDKGKPDEAGKPDDKGKPGDVGKPGDKGKPDGKGKPGGKEKKADKIKKEQGK
jgi:hypothetical protein